MDCLWKKHEISIPFYSYIWLERIPLTKLNNILEMKRGMRFSNSGSPRVNYPKNCIYRWFPSNKMFYSILTHVSNLTHGFLRFNLPLLPWIGFRSMAKSVMVLATFCCAKWSRHHQSLSSAALLALKQVTGPKMRDQCSMIHDSTVKAWRT